MVTFTKRVTWNNSIGLFLMNKKRYFISLTCHYMIWNKYINNDMNHCRFIINPSLTLFLMDKKRYFISLMYIINCTKLYIKYSFSKHCRFINNSNMNHWKKKLLQYLRCALNYELQYISYLTIVKIYNNNKWISNIKNLKSINKYVFLKIFWHKMRIAKFVSRQI
jgi:hypothetical protein